MSKLHYLTSPIIAAAILVTACNDVSQRRGGWIQITQHGASPAASETELADPSQTSTAEKRLLDSQGFQSLLSGQGPKDDQTVVSCECYNQKRFADLAASPARGQDGWDCPNGWLGVCRFDKSLGPHIWILAGAGSFVEGSGAASNFEIRRFNGELGPNGEALPLSPAAREIIGTN